VTGRGIPELSKDGPRTSYKETIKDGHSRRDVGRSQNANSGIRGRGLKQQLRLGSKENVSEALRQTIELEIIKRVAGSSARIQKMSVKTL
jgi:hypothetical protein